ncbi:FAD-linked oxidase C-terminal domain-containing protein [Suttonella ornithocola]
MTQTSSLTTQFLQALSQSKFSGDITQKDAQLTVYSTDNSVYECRPQAILFPRTTADVQIIMQLIAEPVFKDIHLTARGGGTGTNGQSLTNGMIVDISRYMNQIIQIDPVARTARVQAGVVKDQLNAALKSYGLFFAPELSTSNRATIGGMINTDASGQGSLRYGKTHDHVLALSTVLLGGEVLDAEPLPRNDWETHIINKSAAQQYLYRQLFDLADKHSEQIQSSFPKLTRALTGYDLPNLLTEKTFNINSVICGSEGSLGMITEATLNVLPLPKHRALINIGYANFQSALEDAKALLSQQPLSIETVDSKVLGLAKDDIVWESVADYFPQTADTPVMGINLMEIHADEEEHLEARIAKILEHLENDESVIRLSKTVARGDVAIGHIYAMRKRAVGLLGNVQGEKRPQPFVEDTAVPPEHLADFILEFRAVLDDMGLDYGMFGHVDAGVLHVRPLIDMKDEKASEILTTVTEKVVELTHQYGGVLWGEHGKGLRSEYAPKFFGDSWILIQTVKTLFDPHNQLNPGKIATPLESDANLTPLTAIPFRGDKDKHIPLSDWQHYGNTMHCNGNGACFNFAFDDPMCPSWKITRDRVHSPKGRAMLVKEWLRRQADDSLEPAFEKEVYDALHGCLSCKSCAGQCPIKVDIPDSKARFLFAYHQRYRRPVRDYLIGYLEYFIPLMVRFSSLYNATMRFSLVRWINKQFFKLCDPPLLHPEAKANLAALGATLLENKNLSELNNASANSVILVQDAFTRYFDTPVFLDWLKLLKALSFKAYILPYFPNGKPLHVHGFLKQFRALRKKNNHLLSKAAETGFPLIGLDPAMTLVYRQEYAKDSGKAHNVLLPQEWLIQYLNDRPALAKRGETYYLAGHCTEKTQLPASTRQWQEIFFHFGLDLKLVATGCCGMAGTYGHEIEHRQSSEGLFALSWQQPVHEYGERLLTTGYSCRSQTKRMVNTDLQHPLQALLKAIETPIA